MRLLIGVGADVDQHLVPAAEHNTGSSSGSHHDTQTPPHPFTSPCIEAPPFAGAALPVTAVPRILFGFDVKVVDVIHQVLKGVEEQVTLERKAHITFLDVSLKCVSSALSAATVPSSSGRPAVHQPTDRGRLACRSFGPQTWRMGDGAPPQHRLAQRTERPARGEKSDEQTQTRATVLTSSIFVLARTRLHL